MIIDGKGWWLCCQVDGVGKRVLALDVSAPGHGLTRALAVDARGDPVPRWSDPIQGYEYLEWRGDGATSEALEAAACAVADAWMNAGLVELVPADKALADALDALEALTRDSTLRKVKP